MHSKSAARGRQQAPASPSVLTVRPRPAQAMLGVGSTKFWQLVKNGEIEVIRLGPNLTLVPVSGLHDFLARHAKRAA